MSPALATPALGQPLPTPADFPVTWETPAQARQLWMLDRVHFGAPLLPLVADVYRRQVAAGFNRTAERNKFPVRIAFLYANGYLYNSNPPVDLPPALVQKAMAGVGRIAPRLFNSVQAQVAKGITAKYMVQLEPVMATLGEQWEKNWRPEVLAQLGFWRAFDLAGATLPELLAHLDESLKRIERLWALHFEILVPACIAVSRFVDEYRTLLENRDDPAGGAFSVLALLQGADHSFLQADQALWQLSRQARSMPAVRQTLEQHPAAAVIPLLARHAEGQIFLAELRAWLEHYGQRGYNTDGLSAESWLDDPTPVIHNLQESLTAPDQDLVTEIQAQAVERQQRIAQARQRLQSHPHSSSPAALVRFDQQLEAAQCAEFLLTEHNFWIDQQAMLRLRLVFLEVGRRLVQANLLDEAQAVFYLSQEELFATAQAAAPARQRLVQERQEKFAHYHTLTPPDALGTMPWLLPPDEPFVRAFSRLFGEPLVPTVHTQRTSASILRGQAASPGKVRARGRVLRTLEEAERLQRGEILVTTATLPPWTPLLALAGGVVTDSGGILSHAAIIAREYGIPAVVATRVATECIQDGQLLEVDGSAGIVYLLADN